MNPAGRGALLYTMLPVWPKRATAKQLRDQLADRGIRLHVRSVLRDLQSMPPEIVEMVGLSKPTQWARPAGVGDADSPVHR